MALPGGVFDQPSIPWAEAVQTAASKAYLQPCRYVDDVLATWRIIGLLLRGLGIVGNGGFVLENELCLREGNSGVDSF